MDTMSPFQICSHVLAYSNSCINPILYAFFSPPFRKAFLRLCNKVAISKWNWSLLNLWYKSRKGTCCVFKRAPMTTGRLDNWRLLLISPQSGEIKQTTNEAKKSDSMHRRGIEIISKLTFWKTKRQNDKKSLILGCQGSLALLRCLFDFSRSMRNNNNNE